MLTYGCYFSITENNAIQIVSLTVVEKELAYRRPKHLRDGDWVCMKWHNLDCCSWMLRVAHQKACVVEQNSAIQLTGFTTERRHFKKS